MTCFIIYLPSTGPLETAINRIFTRRRLRLHYSSYRRHTLTATSYAGLRHVTIRSDTMNSCVCLVSSLYRQPRFSNFPPNFSGSLFPATSPSLVAGVGKFASLSLGSSFYVDVSVGLFDRKTQCIGFSACST